MKTNNVILGVAAFALVVMAFPPAGAADRTNDLFLTIGDGLVQEDHRTDCTALAVVAIDIPPCLPTQHVRDGVGFIQLGFPSVTPPGPVPLTGTIRALLTSDNGNVDFRCTWNNNAFQGCQVVSGVFPLVGQEYEFSCNVQVPGAQPVGIGNWACFMNHF